MDHYEVDVLKIQEDYFTTLFGVILASVLQ